jgi:hypothetical protein
VTGLQPPLARSLSAPGAELERGNELGGNESAVDDKVKIIITSSHPGPPSSGAMRPQAAGPGDERTRRPVTVSKLWPNQMEEEEREYHRGFCDNEIRKSGNESAANGFSDAVQISSNHHSASSPCMAWPAGTNLESFSRTPELDLVLHSVRFSQDICLWFTLLGSWRIGCQTTFQANPNNMAAS